MKIFNPMKKSKFVVRQLHQFRGKITSIDQLKAVLSDELNEEVPDKDVKYNIGYFEGRHQTKRWIAQKDDLVVMYSKYSRSSEIFLWCDGREPVTKTSEENSSKKDDSTGNKRQMREAELEKQNLFQHTSN